MGKDVIIALDFDSREKTLAFLERFQDEKPFVKIGMELFYAEGPDIVRQIRARGHRIFLDLKLHDIPNTVKKAMAALSALDVDIINLHAAGTKAMMRAALEGLTRPDGTRPLLIAVTQLTSTDQERMEQELLIHAPIDEVVLHYARNARDAGLDGVNISLDTTDNTRFQRITGYTGNGADTLLRVLEECCAKGLKTKINAVLLEETEADAPALAAIAETLPVDVRFIELMPIGFGTAMRRVSPDDILSALRKRWPDLAPTDERRGNGPAHYYKSDLLLGRIGFIDAVSHKFCAECNRVRLTSTGQLKPCLCYADSADLRTLIRGGCTDDELREALKISIYNKPRAHCFDTCAAVTERHAMSQIGG